MNAPHITRLTAALLLASFLLFFSSGCALLGRGNINSRPLKPGEIAELRATPAEAEASAATVKVSIKSEFGRRKSEELPLEQGMTLQDVLVETGVTRRFRDMKINVMRITPQSKGQPVPLQAEYDPTRNCVGVLHDMTLYPGDHVMIVEDLSTPFDEMLGRLTGKPQ